MTRRIAVLVCLLTLAWGSLASAQGLSFGARAGINIAEASFDSDADSPDTSARIGIVSGGFVTIPLVSWLELQPEALYSQKGAGFNEEGIDSSVRLDYVEFPILARVSRRGSGLQYYIAGGPSFAVRVRARARADFSGATEEIDISDEVETTDFGVAFGGGIELGRLVVDARYTFGLKDVDKDDTDAVRVANRAFSFTAGVRF
jgi:hypothetical protein